MNSKPAYIITAAVLVVGAWMFRYEVASTGTGLIVYRLDRWTGALTVATPEFTRDLAAEKPDAPHQEGWWSKYPRAE